MFLIDPGEEPWFVYAYFPLPIKTFYVELKPNMSFADIHLSKKEATILQDCRFFSQTGTDTYTNCAMDVMKEKIISKINCSLIEHEVYTSFKNSTTEMHEKEF